MATLLFRYFFVYYILISIRNCISAPTSDKAKNKSSDSLQATKVDFNKISNRQSLKTDIERTSELDANLGNLAKESKNDATFEKLNASEDDMEIAENMVFRPLFRNRKQKDRKQIYPHTTTTTTTQTPPSYIPPYTSSYTPSYSPINNPSYDPYYTSSYDPYYNPSYDPYYNPSHTSSYSPSNILVYDKKTGSYYPVSASFLSFYSGAIPFSYFNSNKWCEE